MIRYQLHESANLDYLDGGDWTWRTARIGNPSDEGDNKSAFIDDTRRLLIMQTSSKLRAIDLNNMGASPVVLRTVGNLPPDNQARCGICIRPMGCWYTYVGNGGNTIYKIQPPAANPLTDIWTVSTVQIGGAALASQPREAIDHGAVHNTRFFYVRPIGCFAWIAGGNNQVAILKP